MTGRLTKTIPINLNIIVEKLETSPMEDDSEDSNDDDDILLAIIMMASEGETIKQRRQQGRNYLTRADLLPNPRCGTSWEAVFKARNDRAFILTTGFDVDCFCKLLEPFTVVWNNKVIPRNDLDLNAPPRPWQRSLTAVGALGHVLHFLNSTMAEFSL